VGSDGRVGRFVSATRARVDSAWAEVEAKRPHVKSVDATFDVFERDRERAGWLLAGALAHRLFLWLLPFTLVLVAGPGFLASADRESPSHLARDVERGAVRGVSPGAGVFATGLILIGYVRIAYAALWVLPRRRVPWTALLPGALLIGLGLAG
jgi:uncharacterized BrkB/YihY/UPF0761 family membrane protein